MNMFSRVPWCNASLVREKTHLYKLRKSVDFCNGFSAIWCPRKDKSLGEEIGNDRSPWLFYFDGNLKEREFHNDEYFG
jgi:hypothetical protein